LVREGGRFADVDYDTVRADGGPQRFIEDGSVPRDSQQVDTTWRFVNVNGSPDRRFNNNRQLPIMLYGRLTVTTTGGLNWIIDTSRPAFAERLTTIISSA